MTTFNELVDEVGFRLSGFGMRNDANGYLTSGTGITDSALSFAVSTTNPVGRGVIEIDDELIWIDSYDQATGVVTVPPWGRGYLGTTAATHAANSKVSLNPIFTRKAIKDELNYTIRAVGERLFATGSYEFTYNPTRSTYELPTGVESVLGVTYQTIGPSKEWMPVRKWRFDPMASTTGFASGASLTLAQAVDSGAIVHVTYSMEPSTLVNNSDVFTTVTGLPASCQDVITLGACHRMLSFVDTGRLTFESPESDLQSGKITVGSGTNVAKYVFALFQQRLSEESDRLKKRFPIRQHFTG